MPKTEYVPIVGAMAKSTHVNWTYSYKEIARVVYEGSECYVYFKGMGGRWTHGFDGSVIVPKSRINRT